MTVDILKLGRGGAAGSAAASSPTCRRTPRPSLNPALRIGTQLLEVLEAHGFAGP